MLGRTTLAVCLACPLALSAAAAAEDAGAPNVRVTFTVGRAESSADAASYSVLGALGSKTQINAMRRVPLPAMPDDGQQNASAFTFHQIGLRSTFEVTSAAESRFVLDGTLATSMIGEATTPPVVATLDHEMLVVLRDGATVRLLSVHDERGGTIYVDATLDVLD
jgi:hypothetical protein